MYKLFTYIVITTVMLLASAIPVYAQTLESDSSAAIKKEANLASFDFRVSNLKRFFEQFRSPLSSYADIFVAYADLYGLDYRMVPAISGVESTFGKAIPTNSYNAYGWVNGDYKFKSWPDSIQIVNQTLRVNYINKGLASVSQIAHVYAPPSSSWGYKVQYFMNKIDSLPLPFDLST